MAVFFGTADWSMAQNLPDKGVAQGSKTPSIPNKSVDVDKKVTVGDQTRKKWRAVVFRVKDKNAGKERLYTVALGEEFRLPQTSLAIRADHYVPHFEMNRKEIFSASDNLVNPAARVIINEGGKDVFQGWLFQRFPSLRPFEHSSYEITLVEGVSSEKSLVSRSVAPAAGRKKTEIAGRPPGRDNPPDNSRKRETIARYLKLARELHEEGGKQGYDKAIEIYNRILNIDQGNKDALEGIRRVTNAKTAEDRLGK